jgi:RNA polymerase I-specific transcription initiation factor RRN6
MAEIDRRKDSQGTHATNALNYGHLGTASYEADTREWSFLRRCVSLGTSHSAFPFVTLKRGTVYGNSTNNNVLPSLVHNLSSSSTATNRPHPHSAPLGLASANTKEEESLSSAIISSLGQYDPLLSDRLAFGSASLLLDNDVRSGNATVPISALASGTNGESITLTQIGKDRVTITDESHKELVFRIPTITSNSQTSWTGKGEAVLQICFAATSGYQSTWMAARLLSSTTIFHPLFHRRPVSVMTQSSSSSPEIPLSLLDANPILTIPVSRTGGYSHADISFHPLDCHTLALIDQHGNWSMWRIEGKRSVTTRELFRIQMLRTGKLYSWENLRRPLQADPYHDGWHRICWVADDSGCFDRLFLVNRRDAVIHAPLAGEKYIVSLGLGQITEAQWILDAKKSALHPGWIFVLTSTSVFCISTINNEWRDISKAESHTILCSWQHFRGRRDITLSMTILETAYCTVRVVLLEDAPVG